MAPSNQVYGYTYVDHNVQVAYVWNVHQNVNVCDEVDRQREITAPYGEQRADTLSCREYGIDRYNRAGEQMSVDTPSGRNYRFHRGHGDDDLEIQPIWEDRSQMRTPPLSPANTALVVSHAADTPPHWPAPARRNTSSPETPIRNFLCGAEFTRDDIQLEIIGLQALLRSLVREARDYRRQK